MNLPLLTQTIVTGLLLGGLYAVLGIGMSIIFGIMGLTNIAHGNLIILSSFLILTFTVALGGNILVGLLIAIAAMIVIGFLLQNYLVNKVIDKGPEPALLVTFGLSIIIQNVLQLVYGADTKSIRTALSNANVVSTKYVSISGVYLLNFVSAFVLVAVLSIIVKRTRLGRAIRASSFSAGAAELMGVNTKLIYSVTMAIAMVSACLAGVLLGHTFPFYSYSGPQYLIIAFGVVVIGGMGSIGGTLIGGLILGLAQLLGGYFIGTGYQILTGYLVMLVLLTLKPSGLLSSKSSK